MAKTPIGRYEPAHSIIERCGGTRKVAEITGRHISRVWRWTQSLERGGSGGMIPYGEARKLLAFAFANGVDLEPVDFFAEPRLITTEGRNDGTQAEDAAERT